MLRRIKKREELRENSKELEGERKVHAESEEESASVDSSYGFDWDWDSSDNESEEEYGESRCKMFDG